MDPEALFQAISKRQITSFSRDVELDNQAKLQRIDYTSFGGVHNQADTFIYESPAQGWQAGAEGQLRRLELMGQSLKLP